MDGGLRGFTGFRPCPPSKVDQTFKAVRSARSG